MLKTESLKGFLSLHSDKPLERKMETGPRRCCQSACKWLSKQAAANTQIETST